MTPIARAALGLTAAALSGYAVGRPILRGLWRAEKVAWSFAIGLVLQAVLYLVFVLARPGADPTLPLVLFSAALLVLLRRAKTSDARLRPPDPLTPAARGLLLAAAAGTALFAVAALSEPMWAPDYLAVWGLKGKTIFLTASVPARLFHDPGIVWSHPEYPLLLPLDLAVLSTWTRGWDDRAPALLYPLCQAAAAAAVFGFLSRKGRILGGAAAAALVAWFFPLYAPQNVGMADIPMALGFVLLGSAFLDALEGDDWAIRSRLAFSAFFCAALKQEGALLAILAAFVLIARRPRGRFAEPAALALATPVVLLAAVLRIARGAAPSRDFDLGLLAPGRWAQWLSRIGETLSGIARTEIPAAALALAALLAFLLITRRGLAQPLLFLLVAQTAVYVAAISLCAFGPAFLIETAFSRLASTLFPVLSLVIGFRLAAIDDPSREFPSSVSAV